MGNNKSKPDLERLFEQNNIVQDAWAKGQALSIHGCIYRLHDGLLKDLNTSISNPQELQDRYHAQLIS